MDINENNTNCAFAYGGICMSTNGANKPCCWMWLMNESGNPHWSEDHMETEWWQSLIDNLENGVRDPRCTHCWETEDAGNGSMRLNSKYHLDYGNITLHPWSYVDLKLGSKCNLMCTMCDGSASSLIAKEMWDNSDELWNRKIINKGENLYFNQKRITKWYELAGYTDKLQWWQDPKFYDKLKDNAEHIRTLKFTGGEPTLIPQVHEVIDYMIETGYAKNINISITTNGTYKGRDIYEKMCMFKEANVHLSVDGTGAVYNYIRYPHTWDRWTKNTKRMLDYKEKIHLRYQFTTSIFNIFNVREMEDWILNEGGYPQTNYHPNYVFSPRYLNVRYFPEDTLERAVDYLNGGEKISDALIKWIWDKPEISEEEHQMYMGMFKHDTLLKERLRPKRPSWTTIDNNMLRLKDIMYG